MFEWINDPALVHMSSPYRPVHFTNHREWFDSIRKRADMVIFGILVDGRLIGSCQLFNISTQHRNAELQIRIGDPSFRGRGHGTNAVRALLKYGERDLGLHRIYLHVFASNHLAIRCYEKAGIVREGLERHAAFIDGEWRDMALMAKVMQ